MSPINAAPKYASWLSLILSLPLAACGAVAEDAPPERSTQEVAAGVPPQPPGLLGEEWYDLVQRAPVASLGATPVRLANGESMRVDLAASSSFAEHREVVRELGLAQGALLGAAQTTEEFVETRHTVELVAVTRFVVVDPAGLNAASPRLARLQMKSGPGTRLSDLSTEQRDWFKGMKREMLLKPATHPLGAAARAGDAAL